MRRLEAILGIVSFTIVLVFMIQCERAQSTERRKQAAEDKKDCYAHGRMPTTSWDGYYVECK